MRAYTRLKTTGAIASLLPKSWTLMSRKLTIIALVLCAIYAEKAYARENSTGDMFYDEGLAVYNRPWVPSDQYAPQDMFPWSQPFIDDNKDMFDRVPKPGDPNLEAHFSAHVPYVPDEPLYHWPKDQPYP